MSKQVKIWLIIATSLILTGAIVFGGVMMVYKWDFTKLSTVKYETNEYEINEDYKNISISTDTADIVFMPSIDSKCRVVCFEEVKQKHNVKVQDSTLMITIVNTKKWYDYIGISLGTPKITVYLPEKEYGTLFVKGNTGDVEIPKEYVFENINVKLSTGYITLEGVTANNVDLSTSTGGISVSNMSCAEELKVKVSTGKCTLKDITLNTFITKGNTGDVYLSNVIALEKFSIERSTGDIKLENCDANELFIKTDTGDVRGSLLTDKVFIARTDTGRVEVPKTVTGGKCEITTDTGNIKIDIK